MSLRNGAPKTVGSSSKRPTCDKTECAKSVISFTHCLNYSYEDDSNNENKQKVEEKKINMKGMFTTQFELIYRNALETLTRYPPAIDVIHDCNGNLGGSGFGIGGASGAHKLDRATSGLHVSTMDPSTVRLGTLSQTKGLNIRVYDIDIYSLSATNRC